MSSAQLSVINENFDFALNALLLQDGSNATIMSYHIDNLDIFFNRVYQYYVEKGFACLVIGRVSNLVTLGFTILFSTFLLLFVNWEYVIKCTDLVTCSNVELILVGGLNCKSFSNVLVLIYFAIFCLYWLWHLLSCFYAIRDGLEMRSFFGDKLDISESELGSLEWCFVVDRIVERHRDLQFGTKQLSALDITNRIMREDNYMIALFNKQIVDLRLPSLVDTTTAIFNRVTGWCGESIENYNGASINVNRGTNVVFTKLLEYNIRFCLLSVLFDRDFTLRTSITEHPQTLKWRFRLIGLLNFLLLPFLLIFMLIFFFLKNAEEFHSSRSYLGPRQWSPLARWKLREFNELPHFFDQRLASSDSAAQAFIAMFPNRLVSLIAGMVAYIAGSVVAVLLVLTLVDSAIMINIRIFDRSLLFYLAIFSALLAGSRAFITDENGGSDRGASVSYISPENARQALENLVKQIHYFPAHWRRHVWSTAVWQEFSELYKPKVMIFFQEIISVFSTPFILFFTLHDCSDDIIEFVKTHTVNIPGVGDVCSFAMFDFEHNGESSFVTPDSHNVKEDERDVFDSALGSAMQYDHCDAFNTRHDKALPSLHGKMEKSFVTFSINHPHWPLPSMRASQLLTTVDHYGSDDYNLKEGEVSQDKSIICDNSMQESLYRPVFDMHSSALAESLSVHATQSMTQSIDLNASFATLLPMRYHCGITNSLVRPHSHSTKQLSDSDVNTTSNIFRQRSLMQHGRPPLSRIDDNADLFLSIELMAQGQHDEDDQGNEEAVELVNQSAQMTERTRNMLGSQ